MYPRHNAAGHSHSMLRVELLEARDLLSGYQPTAAEQLFLEQLNDARANPAAYGASIGLDLGYIAPSQPLAFNQNLIQAARMHAQDMSDRAYFSHYTPEGLSPGDRILQAGFVGDSWGESLAGGSAFPSSAAALEGLIVDAGVPNLGHRRHLLAIDAVFAAQNQVGIGILQSTAGHYRNYYAIDTGSQIAVGSFLTGVVYGDANQNSRYDIGEGLGGVTIQVSGAGQTTSFSSGGYSLAVQPGNYTVTASGPGLTAPVSYNVTIGTTNLRLSFVVGPNNFVRNLYQTILGRAAGANEVALWQPLLQRPDGRSLVAQAIETSSEARSLLVRNWYVTYLGRTAGPGEEQIWVQAMLRGASEETVMSEILASQEYYDRVTLGGSAGASAFIQSLYAEILHRQPASAEVAGWLPSLTTAGRTAVVAGFLNSDEHRANLIRSHYAGLLGRQTQPTASEVSGWVTSGLGWIQLRCAFESSQEFFNRA